MLLLHSKNRRGLHLAAVKSLPHKRADCLLCAEETAKGQIAQERNRSLRREK